jgi:hypothetical protein
LPPVTVSALDKSRHPEPGVSRVKDLARSATNFEMLTRTLSHILASPREILRGLTATQDDVKGRE